MIFTHFWCVRPGEPSPGTDKPTNIDTLKCVCGYFHQTTAMWHTPGGIEPPKSTAAAMHIHKQQVRAANAIDRSQWRDHTKRKEKKLSDLTHRSRNGADSFGCSGPLPLGEHVQHSTVRKALQAAFTQAHPAVVLPLHLPGFQFSPFCCRPILAASHSQPFLSPRPAGQCPPSSALSVQLTPLASKCTHRIKNSHASAAPARPQV